MKIAFLFLAFIVGGGVQAQHFKQHILFLASDSLHGRAPGSADELKAASYICAQFDSAKCSVLFQKFPFAKDSAINVLGFLDFKKDSTIIISAHYDHLGYGTNKSKEINRKGIHHGADDNASGVAMMIELAQTLSSQKSEIGNTTSSSRHTALTKPVYSAQVILCRAKAVRRLKFARCLISIWWEG